MAKKIYVSYCFADVSEHGTLNSVNYWDMEDISGAYSSIEELIYKLSMWGFPEDISMYDFYDDGDRSYIRTAIFVDADNNLVDLDVENIGVDSHEDTDVYVVDLYCTVSIIDERPMTDEEAKEFGISVD